MNSIFRLLAIYAALVVVLCGVTAMEWAPLRPNSWAQWLVLFLLLFPALGATQFLERRALVKSQAPVIDCPLRAPDCSWLRIAMGTVLVLVTCATVLGVAWWLAHSAAY